METLWIKVLIIGAFTSIASGYLFQPCSPVNYLAVYPGDCNKFLACAYSGYIPMFCPAGLVFDERRQVCDHRIFVPRCRDELEPKGPCQPNPCVRGTCLEASVSSTGYYCQCEPGFWGTDCSKDINECENTICSTGQCINTVGSFVCDCSGTGASGKYCNDTLDACSSTPCMNGGVCKSMGSTAFTCECLPGYAGDLCQSDINECDSQPCQNNGVCKNLVNGFACDCVSPYFGTTCSERNYCSGNPCNNGTCISDVSGFKCDCTNAGKTGTFCDIPIDPCLSNPCVRGVCSASAQGTFVCDCTGTGYTGPTCDSRLSSPCSINPCVFGTCVNSNDGLSYTCNCDNGYTGRLCNITMSGVDNCFPGACLNGVCVDGENTYTCDCTGTVYQGPRCDYTECDLLPYARCMNGGTCLPTIGGERYECQCPTGFTGRVCEILDSTGCPDDPQCPSDVPRYNYPDWKTANCDTYYNCEFGVLEKRSCQAGQKFDVVGMVCKDITDILAVFCDDLRM